MSGHELPPDPRLRAALRHAPDADLQAPPQLRTRLLAAAREAVAPKTPWWQRWLSPSPLGASGAFATLLLAGVIGLLWRGEPPSAVVEPAAPTPVVAAPAPEPPPPAATPAPLAQQAERQALADRAAAAATRKSQRLAEQARAEAATAAKADAAAAAPAAAAATQAATAERAAESNVGALADAAAPAAVPSAAPGPAPTAAPPAAPPPPAPVEARRAPATRMAALAPTAPVQTDWLAAGVSWQVDGAAPAPADSAWLRDLLRLADNRWQPAPPRAVPGALQLLLRSGDARLTLSLGDAEVLWCDAAAACRAAPLSPQDVRRLRDGLRR